MNENEIIESKELRNEMIERINVLEQTKIVLTFKNTDYSTVDLATEFYEVNKKTLENCIRANKEELQQDGLKVYKHKEVKEILESVANTKNLECNKQNLDIDGFKIPTRGLTLITKRALLRIGMLLRDSEVAKEVRSRLLDIVHDASENTEIVENVIEEIRTEQNISEDMCKAILAGDHIELSKLQTELLGLSKKRIKVLEDNVDGLSKVIKNSVTISESRTVVNKCVKTMATCKFGSNFALSWNEFYKFLNYKLGINIKSRKGKGLGRLTDDEIRQAEVIAKSWLNEEGIEFKLNL